MAKSSPDKPLNTRPLILASASKARAALLRAAELEFTIQASDVDEVAIRKALDGEDQPLNSEDIAIILAEAKALDISAARPDALVIAGDQILALDGEIMAKPPTIADAYRQLSKLSGKTHTLDSSIVCAQGGKTLWRHVSTARMTMRQCSPQFLEDYLARLGPKALSSVGAYQLEGLGVHLFKEIEGDYFTILGLPMLPLLDFLRSQKIVPS